MIGLLLVTSVAGLACAPSTAQDWQWRHKQYGFTSGTSETMSLSGTSVRINRNPSASDSKLNLNTVTQPPTRVRASSKFDHKFGLNFWLDANALTSTPIPWKSPVGSPVVVPCGASGPNWVGNQLSSRGVIRFNDTSPTDCLKATSMTADTGAFSVYIVGRLRSTSSTRGIVALLPTGVGSYWSLSSNDTGSAIVANIAGQSRAITPTSTTTPWLASLTHKSGDTPKFYLNNTSATLPSISQTRSNPTLVIGATTSSSDFSPLDLGEVRVYNREITGDEHVALMEMLRKKWGIQ